MPHLLSPSQLYAMPHITKVIVHFRDGTTCPAIRTQPGHVILQGRKQLKLSGTPITHTNILGFEIPGAQTNAQNKYPLDKQPEWWKNKDDKDATTWMSIVTKNIYQIDNQTIAGKFVVDIGAKTGAFAYRALATGASYVTVIEHDEILADLARHNLARFITDNQCEVMELTIVPPTNNNINTPAQVSTDTLDNILRSLANKGRPTDILKLDCGPQTTQILLTAKNLSMTNAICANLGQYNASELDATKTNKPNSLPAKLSEFLTKQNFALAYSEGPPLILWAWRNFCPFTQTVSNNIAVNKEQ